MTFPISQAVVLVGGKGTRLGSITKDTPKPMVHITDDVRFLDLLLENIARFQFSEILLIAGHLGAQVYMAYDSTLILGVPVKVVIENTPLGTAGALTVAKPFLHDRFMMFNGDALFDFNLRSLDIVAQNADVVASIALKKVDDASRYGTVKLEDNRVVNFLEKQPDFYGEALINAGVYALKKEILDIIDILPASIETSIFPKLCEINQLHGFEFDGYFIDIGLPESLAKGRRELINVVTRPAAFLDRDGVLNVDFGYTHAIKDLKFIDGAIDVVKALNDKGYFTIVCTNQAGIARGLYSEDQMHQFHQAMQKQLNMHGAHIDAFYFCPYHPDGVVPEFSRHHSDRKPQAGMLLRAMSEWRIDKANSFMIGDKVTDMQAAHTAGIRSILFNQDNLLTCLLSDKNLFAHSWFGKTNSYKNELV